jgi:hypothetical protein
MLAKHNVSGTGTRVAEGRGRMKQGQHIEKMAIVGDEKWRNDALAFTANDLQARGLYLDELPGRHTFSR